MSYDIYLTDPITGETLHLDHPHHMRGGTYALGGTCKLHLNVTYNYSKHYYSAEHDNGIRTIYGMTGAASIPVLKAMAARLGDQRDDDYWKPTEGNAKAALLQLIALAEMRPDGIWQGD